MLTVHVVRYVPLALAALDVAVFVLPSRLSRRGKLVWCVVLAACGLKGFFYESVGGDAIAPCLPEALIWFCDWACGGLAFLVPVALLWWHRRSRMWGAPLVAWSLSAWGVVNALAVPSVHRTDLEFRHLPKGLDGYRLVQVSDLHCTSGAGRWRTQAVVSRVNSLQPDLICLTGDYADGYVTSVADAISPVLALRARDGVFAVTGNHEYGVDSGAWRRWYGTSGLRLLANTCVFPHAGLAVGGVNDRDAGAYGGVAPDVGRAFASATNGEFRILLEHRPFHAESNLLRHGVDLQLSGHTHGGVMPVLREVIARRNGGFVGGVYGFGDRRLVVSSGCGTWRGLPMRFFTPPQIELIVLHETISAAARCPRGGGPAR